MAAIFYLERKYIYKAPYTREKIVKGIVYSVCDCFTCSFVSFLVVTGIQIMRYFSLVCAKIKIIGYVGFVPTHIICIWLCL